MILGLIKRLYRITTSPIRSLPDFIIVGAQRAGTTSLYNYLIEHPLIMPAFRKEVHFFDSNYNKGLHWYKAFFPFKFEKTLKQNSLTGEASPYYLFYPHTAERIKKKLPKIKIIILLRDPVDRAYSHYNHEVNLGHEQLSFKEAIGKEEERLAPEYKKIMNDDKYYSFNHDHYSYLARGRYIEQIESWVNQYPSDQLIIIRSEDLFNDTQRIISQVFSFLKLPDYKVKYFKEYNRISYKEMGLDIKYKLNEYFKPYNIKLYSYLNKNFSWDK